MLVFNWSDEVHLVLMLNLCVQVGSSADRSGLMSIMPKFLASKFDSDISSSSSSSDSDSEESSAKLRRKSLKTWDANVQVMMLQKGL